MFFLFAVLSMIAYSVQGTLMVHHARKMDGISSVVYRSVSLIITLLPLLFFADLSRVSEISNFSWDFLAAGLTGAVASALSFWSFRYVPVGVANVFSRVASIVFAFVFGFFLFQEVPLLNQLFFVAFIMVGAVFLSFQKKDFSHLDNNASKGIFLSLLSAFFAANTFYFISKISRAYDPFLAGYIWEALIAIFAVIIAFGRECFFGKKMARISLKEFGKIALVCSPTLVGTACFLLAVRLGDFGIVHAIGAGGIFVSLLLSWGLYKEHLTKKQVLWITLIAIGIVGLKLVG